VAKFVKGDVVVVPFPFSDLTQAKRRPALVISKLEGDDLILYQITSQSIGEVEVVTKISPTGKLVIITVYVP
jgi:mRNA interferase MazF